MSSWISSWVMYILPAGAQFLCHHLTLSVPLPWTCKRAEQAVVTREGDEKKKERTWPNWPLHQKGESSETRQQPWEPFEGPKRPALSRLRDPAPSFYQPRVSIFERLHKCYWDQGTQWQRCRGTDRERNDQRLILPLYTVSLMLVPWGCLNSWE